jgi:Family of unknown function (DUF6328)
MAESSSGRDESEDERLDRNLAELLGELRVALPGVQVLFAFLLTVPFSQRFNSVTPVQETVYFGTLMCTAVACALLIAPSVHHRVLFRLQEKEHIVKFSNSLTIAGLAFLAVAMTGVVMLITDVLFGPAATAGTTAGIALLFVVLWYLLPLRRRAKASPTQR